ncbi:MAG: ASKHA domain-containing protein, partial [Anaerolineales bacterium]
MADKKIFTVDMQPIGRRIDIQPGETILDASCSAGVGIISLCGGEGWCDSCQVRIANGDVNEPSATEISTIGQERIDADYRLACQTIPLSDVKIDIPPESLSTPQRLQVEGTDFNIPVAPIVEAVDLELSPPSLHDLRADADRIISALAEQGHLHSRINLAVLKNMSGLIRDYKWSARFIIRENEVIAVLPSESEIFGIAVDIGTTKIAIYLVNLSTGEIVEKTGEMNPQIAYGEDIISRISYTREHEAGRRELQEEIADTLNTKIGELCELARIVRSQIVDSVIVGNTAMHHLFAGLPVGQLVFAPYVPALNASIDLRAKDLGITMAPGAYIHLLPNIAGYVGADHSAVILSTDLWNTNETVLAIDIGTNTEISLVFKGRITSCSCASGPAFEGAHITHGMRAAPGAIERVQIVEGEIKIFTIDDEPPVGICGSGILDVVAEMKISGMMDEKGAINDGGQFTRKAQKNMIELLLVSADDSGNKQDITVSRKDVNEIQLAKAA